ncbi:hypothetical protein ACFQZ4_47150 [Catellatospora coxensis]
MPHRPSIAAVTTVGRAERTFSSSAGRSVSSCPPARAATATISSHGSVEFHQRSTRSATGALWAFSRAVAIS